MGIIIVVGIKEKMQYKFKILSKKPQFTKPDILNSLKRFAEIMKYQSFGMRDYDAWSDRLVTSDTVEDLAKVIK